MASDDNKIYYDEKNGSAGSDSEPVATGHVSSVKRRSPWSLEVEQEESSFAATKSASNADFDPIPPSKRTWNWGAYVAYWMADAWAVSNWEVGENPTIFKPSSVDRIGIGTGTVLISLRSFFDDLRWPQL